MKRIWIAASLSLLLIFVFICAVQAQTNDTFQQAVNHYQQYNTHDTVKKVIKLTVAMKKLPPIPEEARRRFVRGCTLFKNAQSREDFTQVISEFYFAMYFAPWWPEARYNFALGCEAAGKYDDALEALHLYQMFKLSPAEARSVQDKIYELIVKQEKAKEPGKYYRFIPYDNGTVLDTRTNLMWAAEDNGSDIDWQDAIRYCKNYRGGGYTDWQMPTTDELEGLYNSSESESCCDTCDEDITIHVVTKFIHISCLMVWGSARTPFDFRNSLRAVDISGNMRGARALPVRFDK